MTEYLSKSEDRIQAILNNTNQKLSFEHQDVNDIDAFKSGIFENRIDINPLGPIPVYLSLQDNHGAGVFVRQNNSLINSAANEFGVDSNLVKAVIYTEMSRGWYDYINPFGSSTILPGNINETWAALIPGSDVHNTSDNIRITAKLLSEIAERLDEPYPEDIYALYNSMAHDKTYENAETKNTPYFLKMVLDGKAWEHSNWSLPNIVPEDYCFLAGTQISMWDGSKKPIEEIQPDDIVTSYDENGNLVPGRVKRTKTNRAKHILDFHGLMVTPGHAFYCADGKFKGQHVPVLDILRSDGAIQKEDGTIIRAATNCRVGSLEDQFVWVLAGPTNGNTITVTDKAKLRLGTKALLPDGSTRSILDGLIEIYGPVDKMGFCQDGQNVLNHVFHWPFGDKLPKPEDYVLKISQLTTQDIYQHSEWEQAFPPRLPAPLQGESGGSFKQDPVLQASAAPNIPLSMRDSANQPSMSRKQRRAQEAKQRKEGKARPKTLH